MKNFWLTILAVFALLSISQGIGLGSRSVRTVRNFVSRVGYFSKSMKKTYRQSELDVVKDTANEILENTPVVGDILSTLPSSGSGDTEKVEIMDSLQKLTSNLNALTRQLESIKDLIASMPHIISISILQKEVAEDRREIDSCYNNYVAYVGNPQDSAITFRLTECYHKLQFLRELGTILTGRSITFNQKPLFQEIISKSGFCNGTELVNPFKYIYGIYVQGCLSISMAEHLKFAKAKSISRYCQSTTTVIFSNFANVYLQCQNNNSCDKSKEPDSINDIVGGMTDLIQIDNALRKQFPWNYFTLLATEKEIMNNITGSGVFPSMMSLKISDSKYVTVLWFPERSNPLLNDSNSLSYKLEIRQLYRSENGLQLSFHESADYSKPYTSVYGRVPLNTTFIKRFRPCRFDRIYVTKSNNVSPSQTHSKPSNVLKIVGGIFGTIAAIAMVVVPCLIKRIRKDIV